LQSVFETSHADPPNSRASVRTEVIEAEQLRSAEYTNSKIQKFANEWSRAISTSEYAHDIRTNLTKMEKLEIRRNRIWTTMTVCYIRPKSADLFDLGGDLPTAPRDPLPNKKSHERFAT